MTLAETDEHKSYFNSLSQEEKMLLILRDELYGESWAKMSQDLHDRLKGKPYIFKLVNRIEEDLVRIQKLESYEEKHGINLAEYNEGDDQ